MVLLQVDSPRFPILELESDAPRSVDMNRIARRPMTSQPVEVKARQIQVRSLCRRIESVEHQQCPRLEIRPDPATSALFEELAQALVLPGPDHLLNVNFQLSFVNPRLTLVWSSLMQTSQSHGRG